MKVQTTITIALTELRRDLSKVLNRAVREQADIVVTRWGKPVGRIVRLPDTGISLLRGSLGSAESRLVNILG